MNEDMLTGPPVQHLGAVSREYEEPESLDGDFASSAEAEAAEAARGADYDTELTDRDLQDIISADTAARELGTIPRGYDTEGTEGEYEGSGDAIFVQARGQEPRAEEAASHGSGPCTQAVTNPQPPGHFCSMPQSGPKNLHAGAGRAAEQPASGCGESSTLDLDIARYERLVKTLRRQRDQEQLSAEQRAKQERLAALRREYEQLQTAVSQATPRASPGIAPSVSPDLLEHTLVSVRAWWNSIVFTPHLQSFRP